MYFNYPYHKHPYLPYSSLPPYMTHPLPISPNQFSKQKLPGQDKEQVTSQMPKQEKQSSEKAKKDQSDKQKKKQQQKQPNAMISFDKLSVGTVSSSSGIFNGKNIQFGWSSQSKSNTGFGKVSGHNNQANENTNVVFDDDQIDTPIDDRDTMWSTIPKN